MIGLVTTAFLAAVPSLVPAQTVKLNGPLAQQVDGRVGFVLVGTSGTHAVYFADQDTDEQHELYGVPVDGSAPSIKLSPPLAPGWDVWRSLALSADGSRIAFLLGNGVWAAVTDGSSAAVQLTGPIAVEDANNAAVFISPDGQWVAYSEDLSNLEFVGVRADGTQPPVVHSSGQFAFGVTFTPDSARMVFRRWESGVARLHSVPVDGSSAPVELSGALIANGDVQDHLISADGGTVVYLADQETDEVVELYSVPADGSATPVKLNAALVMNGDVGHSTYGGAFAITADGTRVVYVADQEVDEKRELYVVPIDGSAQPVKLSGTLAANRDVGAFRIAADSRRVVFLADAGTDEVVELHLAWLDGNANPARLNGPLASGGDVVDFQLSADSRHAVYRADQVADGRFELFAAPLPKLRRADAPRAVRLNPPPVTGGSVASFFIDAGSRHVVYRGDVVVDTLNEDFSVPITGGPSVALMPALGPGGSSVAAMPAPGGRALCLLTADANAGQSLYSAPADGSAPAVQLNGSFVSGSSSGEVAAFQVTSDGAFAVYAASAHFLHEYNLFSVPAHGGAAPIELSGPMVYGGSLGGNPGPVAGSFVLSPDTLRCAYIADQDTLDLTELYGAPLDGSSAAVRLDATGGAVQHGFSFSPDSSRVVYRAYHPGSIAELYSVPADGSSSPVRLNGNVLSASAGIEPDFAVSANSARVVYRSDETVLDKLELFTVPLDGSAPRARLNASLGPTRDVLAFAIDPIGTRVVFLADASTEDAFELYSVPLAGGVTPTRLNDALASTRDVTGFRISPDGTRVVYVVDQVTDELYELYSVPIDRSSAPVKLSGTLVAGGDVLADALQVASGRVAYLADQDVDGRDELYSAPLDGSAAAIKLNTALVPGADVKSFQLSAGVARAVYRANASNLSADELFVVPLDGSGSALQLSGAPAGRSVLDVALDGAGVDAIYRMHLIGDLTEHELLHVPLDGSSAPTTLTSAFSYLPAFTIAPGTSLGVYLSNSELYSTQF